MIHLASQVNCAVALAAALAAGCAGAPSPHQARGEASASHEGPIPILASSIPDAPYFTALGATRSAPLDIAILPVSGDDSILAVHDFADHPRAFAQRVAADGALGPAIALEGAHVFSAFAAQDPSQLVIASVEGRALCVSTFAGAARKTHGCSALAGHAWVRGSDDKTLVLSLGPKLESAEAQAAKKKPAARVTRVVAKRRPGKRPAVDPVASLLNSGRELSFTGQWLDASANLVGEPIETGLDFVEPMAGMNLIGAVSRDERVDLVFYERASSKGTERRARVGAAALDRSTGELVPESRKSLAEAKLELGFVEGHQELRLVPLGDKTLLLGQRSLRGKCDASIVAPFVMQMIPDEAFCGVEPRGFGRIAAARRKNEKVEPSPIPDLGGSVARRAFAQAEWDVGRSVVAGDRAYALVGHDLVSWDERGTLRAERRPLVAERLRVRWGAVDVSGSAIAETEDGLVIAEPGRVPMLVSGAGPRFAWGPDRPDVAVSGRTLAARVGTTWLQARGELTVLTGPNAGATSSAGGKRRLSPDTAVVVGGTERGLLLELRGRSLAIESVDASGTSDPVARVLSPVGPGFDAVRRATGGALVVGPDRSREGFVAFEVQADGRIGPVRRLAFDAALTPGPVRMVALPKGGALAFDAARTKVQWLDDAANPLAIADWPGSTEAACLDGRPMPRSVPTPEPGRFADLPIADRASHCVVSEMVYTQGGSVRWIGSASLGIHARAEIGDVPLGDAFMPPAVARESDENRASRVPLGRCPSEMVEVGEALCVDRFEATLVDGDSGRFLSPHYPATPNLLDSVLGDWSTRRERQGDLFARSLPLPDLSAWQREHPPVPIAESRAGVQPSGYVTGLLAKSACERAEKRLCKLDEWKLACKGERGARFPYGSSYDERICNVGDTLHPASLLHGSSSMGHLDPRLNALSFGGAPRPLPSGSRPRCASRWGDDAIFDMVGNLDEWVDEKGGAFAGGFYARATTNGCDAIVTAHPPQYLDYSTGVRCCKDVR